MKTKMKKALKRSPTNPGADGVDTTAGGVNAFQHEPLLLDVFLTLLGLDRANAKNDYQIGKIISVVTGASNYGDRAVEMLATELDYKDETLRKYARVGCTWTQEEFEVLMTRKNARGRTISFAHLVEASRLCNREARQAAVELTFLNALTVQDLKSHIEGGAVGALADHLGT